jgi:23S rRNA pseudouridine2605 synthase
VNGDIIPPVEERLQKILARAGFASRRGAEQLMLDGRVSVNGKHVRELGTKADLENDDVRVDGVRVKAPHTLVYLVLNKPRGVVTTRKDPEGRPTVMTLVPHVAGLFPVGRLDVTTEGLILLTNDGAFAERVSHPRYEVPRVYHAKVHRVPDPDTLDRLKRGVRVEGDFMAVDRARVIHSENNAWVELTLHEGKQHEVKRLLEAVGHPVSKLRRVAFGPVTTKGLEPGQFRALTPDEIAGLRKGEGGRAPAMERVPRRRRQLPAPALPAAPARPADPARPERSTRSTRPAAPARGARGPKRAEAPLVPRGSARGPREMPSESPRSKRGAIPRRSGPARRGRR